MFLLINYAENSSEVLARWEQIKTEERAQKAQHSALDDIPHHTGFNACAKNQETFTTLASIGRRFVR